MMNSTKEEQPHEGCSCGGAVFRLGGSLLALDEVISLFGGGYLYLQRPWSSSQILSGKGANNGHFEGEHLVQVVLTKVGLRLPKALVMTPSWAPR